MTGEIPAGINPPTGGFLLLTGSSSGPILGDMIDIYSLTPGDEITYQNSWSNGPVKGKFTRIGSATDSKSVWAYWESSPGGPQIWESFVSPELLIDGPTKIKWESLLCGD